MANHFSQYAVLLLLIISSALMITAASSEVCNKNGGGVGDNNCSSLQQKRCKDKLHMAGGGCDQQWCTNACALEHFGQRPEGKCYAYRVPNVAVCICNFNCY